MTARVVRKYRRTYGVVISHGVQSFSLNYFASKTECDWMARMFRKALHAHDAVKQKARRG